MSRIKRRETREYAVEMPGSRWRDVGGMRFGRLLAVEPTGKKLYGQHVWRCICSCGNEVEVTVGSLTAGQKKSCGCLVKEAPHSFRHGMSDTPVHNRWMGMMRRCYDESCTSYHYYGGRGVQVCKRWHTFENFYKDMGDVPFERAQIDRIDPDYHYTLNNCRWVTPRENSLRRRKTYGVVLQIKVPPLKE